MRVFIACLGTETNVFAPIPADMALFENTLLVRDGVHSDPPHFFAQQTVTWRDAARAEGHEVIESLSAFATPAGITVRAVYEELRDRILDDLRAAMPVDLVLLGMHGAMIADGYDDCEADLAARVREIVGPGTEIGIELDLHCHLSQQLVDTADVIVIYKEYPHIDIADRAREVWTLTRDAALGRTRPVMALVDCAMIDVLRTTQEPMKSFVARMKQLETEDGILSVSLAHGFPWADIPDMGTRVLVVADGDRDKAESVAQTLAEELVFQRHAARTDYLSIDHAIDRAMAARHGPVVLADVSDNPGAGCAGDSTFILQRLLERHVPGAALACIWDPVAASLAFAAGLGGRIPLRIGGKVSPHSGTPVDALARVVGLKRNATQLFGAGLDDLGDAAAVDLGGVVVIVNSTRTQTFHPMVFEQLGIDPAAQRLLVVKSMQHFHAGFAPVAADILYVAAPGASNPDVRNLPYTRITRPKWPLDPHPWDGIR